MLACFLQFAQRTLLTTPKKVELSAEQSLFIIILDQALSQLVLIDFMVGFVKLLIHEAARAQIRSESRFIMISGVQLSFL